MLITRNIKTLTTLLIIFRQAGLTGSARDIKVK